MAHAAAGPNGTECPAAEVHASQGERLQARASHNAVYM